MQLCKLFSVDKLIINSQIYNTVENYFNKHQTNHDNWSLTIGNEILLGNRIHYDHTVALSIFPIRIFLHHSQHSSCYVLKKNFSSLVAVCYNTLKMCLVLACRPIKFTYISSVLRYFLDIWNQGVSWICTLNVTLLLFLKWRYENCPRKYTDFGVLSVTNQLNMYWCPFPDSVPCVLFFPIKSFNILYCDHFSTCNGAFL